MLGNLFNRISQSRIGQFIGNVGRKIGQIYDTAVKVPIVGDIIRKSPVGVAIEGFRRGTEIGKRIFQKPEPVERAQEQVLSRYPGLD